MVVRLSLILQIKKISSKESRYFSFDTLFYNSFLHLSEKSALNVLYTSCNSLCGCRMDYVSVPRVNGMDHVRTWFQPDSYIVKRTDVCHVYTHKMKHIVCTCFRWNQPYVSVLYGRIATKCDFMSSDQIQFSDFNSSPPLLGGSKAGTVFIINRVLRSYRTQ